MTINYTSNHPNEQKMAAYRYLTNRMTSLLCTTDRKETEWQKILSIAENNKFPLHLITRLKRQTDRQNRQQKQQMDHLHISQPQSCIKLVPYIIYFFDNINSYTYMI
jgi:hypothetical protein